MNLSDAKQLFAQGGGNALALLEAAREYMDAHDYSLAEVDFWMQADLVLSAISSGDDALISSALRLWKTSPGASGRLLSRDPEDERRIGVTDAAEAAGVTRGAVKKAIGTSRLVAEKNVTGNYEITHAEFRRWQATIRAPNGRGV